MDIEQARKRIERARARIYQELCDLSDDLGDGFEVDLLVSWVSVGTFDNPSRRIPAVDVYARVG